ncbi:uncharacterized protein BDZ99DRAFT_497792 [Mytilinidion resinicola]|uniref:Uncharacterized protein n=1 Tax=Mytilinidion resinicola TaxID=574789 RepID=A0A6A6YQ13_9PEZI|nr:uncharacterized protein BDZ99DRAFT_497792 [Mytilinidion resinicola]KAF2810851.1 hypothetical protein BDZ99DRAFT_497792 [Mytilinidion resinicola]
MRTNMLCRLKAQADLARQRNVQATVASSKGQQAGEDSNKAHPEGSFDAPPEEPEEAPPFLVFSVTTQGPLHQLWVHYQPAPHVYHMTPLKVWNAEDQDDAKGFMRAVFQILQWGSIVHWNEVHRHMSQIAMAHDHGVMSPSDRLARW